MWTINLRHSRQKISHPPLHNKHQMQYENLGQDSLNVIVERSQPAGCRSWLRPLFSDSIRHCLLHSLSSCSSIFPSISNPLLHYRLLHKVSLSCTLIPLLFHHHFLSSLVRGALDSTDRDVLQSCFSSNVLSMKY